jgi:hypothetical protein
MLKLVFGQKANFALSLLQKKDPEEEEEEDSKPNATFPSFAVIALIAMGEEDIGVEMSFRQFNRLVSDIIHSFFDCANDGVSLIKDALWRTHNSESRSLLVSSSLQIFTFQILTFPTLTHYLNTATITIFKLP